MDTEDAIVADVFENQRSFLPGRPNTKDDIVRSMKGDLYVDDVTSEAAQLMLSTLPRDIERLHITPMDKGFSGSKVYAVRYQVAHRQFSKPFVFKIGPLAKIDQEADAVVRLVAPRIMGIETPIVRRSVNLGLIGQELRGLKTADTVPESLRMHVRHAERAHQVVDRLLRRRLAPWYEPDPPPPVSEHRLGELFQWHLNKMHAAPNAGTYPEGWDDLQRWVQEATGIPWLNLTGTIERLKRDAIVSRTTIIHGDLHSQNVLVECKQDECWPIDFAWCREEASPAVDCAMLECSIRFLSIPMRADLRTLLDLDYALLQQPHPKFALGHVPYRPEISNAWSAVMTVRRYVLEQLEISFDDYRKCLALMTYTLSNHDGLNLPYVLSSLQIATGLIARAR